MPTIDEYREALHDPKSWMIRSVSLFQSAEATWRAGDNSGFGPGSNHPMPESPLDVVQAFGFYKVAMMLYGLAVETALKAILVSQKSDSIVVHLETNGGGDIQRVSLKTVGDAGGGHNLIELAKNAGLISRNEREDVDEKSHLAELSAYVAWRGRYPVAKSVSATDEQKERRTNVETIAFVHRFLRAHLRYPD